MTGRRVTIGLSLLCALVFCAFAAPNAMALKGTTFVTCEPEPKPEPTTKGFEDEHCTKPAEGLKVTFKHGFFPPNNGVTPITLASTETKGKILWPKLKGIIAGVEFEVEAGGFQSCINKVTIENNENGAKQMEALGETCGEFFNVVVNKPAKCKVKGGSIKTPEKGKFKTVVKEVEEGKSEMYVEFLPPEATKVFLEFEFEGAECVLKGVKVEAKGSANANKTLEEGKLDGPTLLFTTKETEKTLFIGGKPAAFEALFTARMLAEPKVEENPIALTTTFT